MDKATLATELASKNYVIPVQLEARSYVGQTEPTDPWLPCPSPCQVWSLGAEA